MGGRNGEGTPFNSFALVSYLPDPLAGFVDRLRAEFDQECHARAHLTLLPPRPLGCTIEEAWEMLRDRLQDFPPVLVELGDIEIFPVTQVIYVSVKSGLAELEEIHARLNNGRLGFNEPFVYHPHVTLAQDIEPAQVASIFETAASRWRGFSGPRSYTIDQLKFVQNTLENRWMDLRACSLDSVTI